MDRRNFFELIGGLVTAAVTKSILGDKPVTPIIHSADQCDSLQAIKDYHLGVGGDIITFDDQNKVTIGLPKVTPDMKRRQLTIKNNSTFEAITVVSDGETWHLV